MPVDTIHSRTRPRAGTASTRLRYAQRVLGAHGSSRTMDGTERVLALDEETGAILWTHTWRTTYRALLLSYAAGPMATPTVDGDRVYVLGNAERILRASLAAADY